MFRQTIEDGIVIVTLANGKTNPITREIMKGIGEEIRKVNEDESLKGLILTGDGRFFSSGFDLPTFINFKDHGEAVAFFQEAEDFLLDLFVCKKPVVCAMNGHSAAMGIIMAMASDYRLVVNHPKVKLGMSEIRIGLPLAIAQTEVMRYGLDTDKTFEKVMYFGEMMSPEAAKAIGMADEIVEAEALLERAKAVICGWIDTPNRPFIRMKELVKYDTAERIRTKMKTIDWKEGLHCFFDPNVRGTLEFVQAAMMG